MTTLCIDDGNTLNYLKQDSVNEIEASSVRSGLVELELRASQVLQSFENVKSIEMQEKVKSDIETETVKCNNIVGSSLRIENALTLLQTQRKPPEKILKALEMVISHTDANDDSGFSLPALDDVSHLALISHSIVAYLSHLNKKQLVHVTSKISDDVTNWLASLFRFTDSICSFHNDTSDATLNLIRLAIQSRCPGSIENGIPALAQLCFYISENITPQKLQFACHQMGIPFSAIRLIATNTTFGTMDLSALQKHIQVDLAAHRIPVLVIADISDSVCGYVDNLKRMWDICKSHNIWLHANGHGLAALACFQGSGSINSSLDSLMLQLGLWLGVPSLPIVLLHRSQQPYYVNALETDLLTLRRRLNSLTLWTSLQALGSDTIYERTQIAFQICSTLFEISSKCEGIRVVSKAPGAQTGASLMEVSNKPLDVNLLFDSASPLVVFQFDGSVNLKSSDTKTVNAKSNGNNNTIEKTNNASYFDCLNSWLGQILQRDLPNFNFKLIELTGFGTCIRYCPFEFSLGDQPPSAESLEHFAENLESHVDILRATIKHKATFLELVKKSDVLRLVNLPEWAGMGGVRFVPEGWETLLTDQAKHELNKLNTDLVESLKAADSAFSLGEGSDGLICVRFGMVTHETDVDELLDLVITVGKSVQENSRVLDTMSEIVKRGIETATADLRRETEEKLWQEGILRHVPVVGRVFNWWSPPAKETGVKGRSLNLTQGVVESTENIYKYHMQMTGMSKAMWNSTKSASVIESSSTVTIDDTTRVPLNKTSSSSSSLSPISPTPPSVEQSQLHIREPFYTESEGINNVVCPRSISQSSSVTSVTEAAVLSNITVKENIIDSKASLLLYNN